MLDIDQINNQYQNFFDSVFLVKGASFDYSLRQTPEIAVSFDTSWQRATRIGDLFCFTMFASQLFFLKRKERLGGSNKEQIWQKTSTPTFKASILGKKYIAQIPLKNILRELKNDAEIGIPAGWASRCNVRSKFWWFTRVRKSHYLSQFAAFFIEVRAEGSTVKSCYKIVLFL